MKLKFKALEEIIKSIYLFEYKSHAYIDEVHYSPKASIIAEAIYKKFQNSLNSKLIFL